MVDEQPPIISTSSAVAEKNKIRQRLEEDMARFFAAGKSVEVVEVKRAQGDGGLSSGRRRKNNDDAFSWREDIGSVAAQKSKSKRKKEKDQ